MPLLFDRKVSLQLDTLVITDLRITFKIEKDSKPEPNKATVSVYNLNDESRAKVQKKDAAIVLQAGYPDTIAQIFSGTVSKVANVREGADWITKIITGDGEKQYRTARVSESFNAGATIQEVAKKLIGKIGLKEGNAITELSKGDFSRGLQDFANGKAVNGLGSKELGRLLKSVGYDYSIQDGALQILKPNQSSKLQTVELNSGTGLIGSPEFGETGEGAKKTVTLRATSLLNPKYVPGGKVHLQSQTKSGYFYITKVSHEGDSFGGSWYSKLELTKLSETTNVGNLTQINQTA